MGMAFHQNTPKIKNSHGNLDIPIRFPWKSWYSVVFFSGWLVIGFTTAMSDHISPRNARNFDTKLRGINVKAILPRRRRIQMYGYSSVKSEFEWLTIFKVNGCNFNMCLAISMDSQCSKPYLTSKHILIDIDEKQTNCHSDLGRVISLKHNVRGMWTNESILVLTTKRTSHRNNEDLSMWLINCGFKQYPLVI